MQHFDTSLNSMEGIEEQHPVKRKSQYEEEEEEEGRQQKKHKSHNGEERQENIDAQEEEEECGVIGLLLHDSEGQDTMTHHYESDESELQLEGQVQFNAIENITLVQVQVGNHNIASSSDEDEPFLIGIGAVEYESSKYSDGEDVFSEEEEEIPMLKTGKSSSSRKKSAFKRVVKGSQMPSTSRVGGKMPRKSASCSGTELKRRTHSEKSAVPGKYTRATRNSLSAGSLNLSENTPIPERSSLRLALNVSSNSAFTSTLKSSVSSKTSRAMKRPRSAASKAPRKVPRKQTKVSSRNGSKSDSEETEGENGSEMSSPELDVTDRGKGVPAEAITFQHVPDEIPEADLIYVEPFLWSEETPYQCSICLLAFPQKSRLDAHTGRRVHKLDKNREKKKSMYECYYCCEQYHHDEISDFLIHLALNHSHPSGKQFWCKDCDQRFMRKAGLMRHSESRISCVREEIQISSVLPEDLTEKQLEFLKPFIPDEKFTSQCSVCMKCCQPQWIGYHMKKHGKALQSCRMCSFCKQTFDLTETTELFMHMALHAEEENPYACPKCSYRTNSEHHLTTHIQSNCTKNTVKPPSVIDSDVWDYLEETLTGEECDFVLRQFKTRPVSMYQCSQCLFCFHSLYHLNKHRKDRPSKHNSEGNLECYFCHSEFGTTEHLELLTHIGKMHADDIEPFHCKMCDAKFKLRSNLGKHWNSKHSKQSF